MHDSFMKKGVAFFGIFLINSMISILSSPKDEKKEEFKSRLFVDNSVDVFNPLLGIATRGIPTSLFEFFQYQCCFRIVINRSSFKSKFCYSSFISIED